MLYEMYSHRDFIAAVMFLKHTLLTGNTLSTFLTVSMPSDSSTPHLKTIEIFVSFLKKRIQ